MRKHTIKEFKRTIVDVLLAVLGFLLTSLANILPVLITIVIAYLKSNSIKEVVFNDFIKSGNLVWLGCVYAGVILLEILFEKRIEQNKTLTRIMIGITVLIIVSVIMFYVPMKEAYLNLSNAVDQTTILYSSVTIYLVSGVTFLTYLICRAVITSHIESIKNQSEIKQ